MKIILLHLATIVQTLVIQASASIELRTIYQIKRQ